MTSSVMLLRGFSTSRLKVPGPVVDVPWLKSKINDGVRVLDASWYMPAEKRSGKDEFRSSRILGAQFFDIDAVW
jgi:thiosulfate/3-mercaptopyruvate sulfurtransferase